jgi:hypothetical protein
MLVAMSLIAKHIKKTMTDGSTVEEYFWAGALHRVDGPAMVRRNADGSWIEQYYRMGKLHRVDGPAIIWRKPDGSMSHAYHRDDERYQRLLGWAGDDLCFERPRAYGILRWG